MELNGSVKTNLMRPNLEVDIFGTSPLVIQYFSVWISHLVQVGFCFALVRLEVCFKKTKARGDEINHLSLLVCNRSSLFWDITPDDITLTSLGVIFLDLTKLLHSSRRHHRTGSTDWVAQTVTSSLAYMCVNGCSTNPSFRNNLQIFSFENVTFCFAFKHRQYNGW